MGSLCNAAKPDGVLRCDRAKGHRGFHASIDIVNHQKVKVEWPSHKAEKRARMNDTSPDQEYRTGVLHGIMAKTIQIAMEKEGRFYCEGGCGRSWSDVHAAMRDCAPAHVRPRANRPRSKAHIFQSEDAPVNVKTTCLPCNDKVDIRATR